MNHPAMAEVFGTWYTVTGGEAKIDPVQIASWPAWFRDDINFIFSELAHAREEADEKKESKTPAATPPKPKKRMKRR